MKPASFLISIAHLLACSESAAFIPSISGGVAHPTVTKSRRSNPTSFLLPTDNKQRPLQMMSMIQQASLFGTTIIQQRPRIAALAAAFLLLAAKVLRDPRAFFWPGARVDKNSDADLPEGSMGCPFMGIDIFTGSTDYGPFAGLRKLSSKYGTIFRTYAFGIPIVSVSGVDNIKSLFKNEFREDGVGTFMVGANLPVIFGGEMLLYENNSKKHSMLRRLVANAMTPNAIAAAVPDIQERAVVRIDDMLQKNGPVVMEDAFESFTLDIAWKQILGLDLEEEEVPKFHAAVVDWTKGLSNRFLMLPFKLPGLTRYFKCGRASAYLKGKIEEKIAKLERDGPDSSTLSMLYFSTDEDGTRLTHDQVVDNSLLMIFAGTETSASTLTCAALFLALHPDAWEKVRAEQEEIVSKYGNDLTAEALEDSTYLDAVIKETLRIQPIETGELRAVRETIIVDGKQLPKGWKALFNVKQTHINDPSTYEADGSHMDHIKGFKPERWLSESTKPKEWMPFGDGRRRCVGERLGMTEMKAFMSMLARKVAKCELVNKIESSHDIEWQASGNVLARPSNAECNLILA